MGEIEPLTEHQILNICGLQQSTQESEEALSEGLEALNQSLSDTIAADSLSNPPNMANYMGQMTLAINKLSTLEGFVRQVPSPISLHNSTILSTLNWEMRSPILFLIQKQLSLYPKVFMWLVGWLLESTNMSISVLLFVLFFIFFPTPTFQNVTHHTISKDK